jgi:hypothetical protein
MKERKKTLFINEKIALEKMLADGISEDVAMQAITDKRKDKLSAIDQEEAKSLIEMANNNVDINEAVGTIKQKRQLEQDKWASEHPIKNIVKQSLVDVPVGLLSRLGQSATNIADFATMGKVP